MIMYRIIIPCVVICLLGSSVESSEIESHYDETVFVVSDSGKHIFKTEIAKNSSSQAKGLMFRKHMQDDNAMLFDFTRKAPKIIHMWMKNTYIPLDMLFLDMKGKIVFIHKNASPLSLRPISSNKKVSAVMEINSGISDKLDIKVGDHVVADIFR